ncbi:DUF4230 domain-containing protein [Mesobacillus maritimus]|uniref:DUF4230 domain-containing protein n=1 Tax=Mesobacillus maritimus TaxID=1643336 RepID=UPI00203D59BE|nr:DUF4230 domain-containing protein [Mesobacillus maritimus]MCM3668865.1 DUF4230 domain-containing protein [Mesobacillus maritimus]
MNDQQPLGKLQQAESEVHGAAQETAATITQQPRGFVLFTDKWSIRLTLAILLLLGLSSIGIFSYSKIFVGSTFQSESFSMVESIQNLATLTSAEAYVTTVLKEEDNKLFNQDLNVNFPGTRRTLLLIVPAKVLAGVDLKEITSKDIKINEDKKEISIVLPHAQLLQEPSIHMDKVQTYSEEGLFRQEVNWSEGFDLAAKAKSQIEQEAIELGLLIKAEESAEQILQSFFHQLGYSSTITFE